MLHPVDYRLSKNKFWLSTWNSYSLKNYRNLMLNDKILNILGYIFKNCFKSSYSFASPWSNPRKYRKYFPNFVIGFDGRRAIRTGPNKVKKLPGFVIPEDYHIIRFSNFIVLKIYFLIDRNLETYWVNKQKNWRSPLKYYNMRYHKIKNKDNLLKFSRNLFNSNIEKKNFKSTGFFMYLINLLNNNYIKKTEYFSFYDKYNWHRKDKRYALFRFYYNNFKLLNKIRHNYFLLYLSDKSTSFIYKDNNLFNFSSKSCFKNSNYNSLLNNNRLKKCNKIFDNFELNYNLLYNFNKNYRVKYFKDILNFYDIRIKKTKIFPLNNYYLSKKILHNNKNLKAFSTFNLLNNNKSILKLTPQLRSLKLYNIGSSLKLSLILNKSKLSNKSNFLSYVLNSYLNKYCIFSKKLIKNVKLWSNNLFFISKKLYYNKYRKSKYCKYIFKSNILRKKLNKFSIGFTRKKLPLLLFKGFLKKKKKLSSSKKFKKKLVLKNLNKNIFRIFNINYTCYKRLSNFKTFYYKKYSFYNNPKNIFNYKIKSKFFWEFFILHNRLTKSSSFINSYKFNKNFLIFLKNLNSLKNSKYLIKYNNRLSNNKLKAIKKNIIFFNYAKHNYLFNNNKNIFNLALYKLKLNNIGNKWSNLFKILNINKLNKKKNIFKKSLFYKKKNLINFSSALAKLNNINYFNLNNNIMFIQNKTKYLLAIIFKSKFKKSTRSKKIYKKFYVKKSFLNIKKRKKFKRKKNFINNNKFIWGKSFLFTNNFNKSRNYNFAFKECLNYLPIIKSKKKVMMNNTKLTKEKVKNSILEYKPFLTIMQLNINGFNFTDNCNINYSNYYLYNYINNSKKIKRSKYNFNNKVSIVNKLPSLNFKWNLNKIFEAESIFNLYYKKTFSRAYQKQDEHSIDDIYQVELLLKSNRMNNRMNKLNKLLKFKPYSMRSVSKIQRFKSHNSILTNYIKVLIKQNYLFDFHKLMEDKKFIFTKHIDKKHFKLWKKNIIKAKGTALLQNISSTAFNCFKALDYSVNPFFEKLSWLKFFNKNIENKESDPFKHLKKNKKKYVLKNLDLSEFNYKYINHLISKVQFNYFKRKRWAAIKYFNDGLYFKNIIIKPYKALLFSKDNYKLSSLYNSYSKYKIDLFNNNKINFNKKTYYTNNFNSLNIYKYKMINYYKCKFNNKVTEMNRFILKFNNFKMSYFVTFIFKKNHKDDKFFYNKSTNTCFNKYIQSRFSNFFFSINELEKHKKNSKFDKEDLDLRIYGLGYKLRSPRIKFIEKKKKINKFKPKPFKYWKHLKWFNLFIKIKFNSNVHKNDNFYVDFRTYENFKRLNFNYYKNNKESLNINNNNKIFSLVNLKYNKLNSFIYFTSLFKSKKSFIYIKNYKHLYKKKLLLNWSHNLKFSINNSKRLGYVTHLRYRALKNSTYMWKINTRKLNLLTKYYRARSKFYKNKLNFVSKNLSKSSIISYLRLMESNFFRIRKTMQRGLPLISIKRYLKFQLKKLNIYMKVLLKRIKRRYFLRLRKNKSNRIFRLKFKKFNKNIYIKEKKLLPKKLFNFVKKRFNIEKKNLIDYIKEFVEHLFLFIFKFDNLRIFYLKKYRMNVMGTKAKLFKNLFNYRLATGFKVPFLVKIICKKLSYDKSLVGCKIGFFGRYSKKLRNRKIWRYIRHIKPSVISTPLDYYNVIILQKWGITGIKLSMLRKKTFNFIYS